MATKKFAGARVAPPHETTLFDDGVMLAIKALGTGTANERQQQIALNWIIHECAATFKSTYFPESQRDSDFASGKRWVGQQIVSILNMSPRASKQG